MTEQELQEKLDSLYKDIHARLLDIESLCHLQKGKQLETLMTLGKLVTDLEAAPFGHLMQQDTVATRQICTRLSAVYIRLLTDFSFQIEGSTLFLMIAQKRFMNYCLEMSGYDGDLCIQDLLRKQFKDKNTAKLANNQAAIRMLLLATINTIDTQDLINLTLEESDTAAILTLGLLLDRMPVSLQGEAARKLLLVDYNPWDQFKAQEIYKHVVANVWMLCSYATTEYKHVIKQRLNQWFKRLHLSKGLKVKPTGQVKHTGNSTGKPVMAVAAESFHSSHAMFRWYSPIIRSLKQHYYVVLLALEGDVDQGAKALFDEFLAIPEDEIGLQPVLNACTPDVVYFPSVGMRAWAISLANIRWAPLQLMSLGHPATSFSTEMDAVFLNSKIYGGTGHFTENQLVLNSDVGNSIQAHQQMKLPEKAQLPDDFVRIAVPCNVMKINVQFLAALKEIQKQAAKPVQFLFMPNDFSLGHLSTSQRLKQHFPNCIVAQRTTYEHYLAMMNQCHFALSTFPFGNSTSAIDCLVLGMPFIALIGIEPHSRSDYNVLCTFGLEDYCVADSVENYIQGAVNWINNPDVLQAMREFIASKNFLDEHLNEESQYALELCDALKWAVTNQETLRSVRGQVFTGEGRWETKSLS